MNNSSFTPQGWTSPFFAKEALTALSYTDTE